MIVLMVTPVEGGSGETVTARYLGSMLVKRGHRVHFLASPFAARFLSDEYREAVWTLGFDGPANVALWARALRELNADVIVFADYPLMFLRTGVVPLGREPGWEQSVCELGIPLVTLDHFGFAQGSMGLFMGPPHLCHDYHRFENIPASMRIMLPCPMHEPGGMAGRRGTTFRYWDVPLAIADDVRAATRQKFDIRHDLVVLHIVSTWAWQSAESFGLAFYRHLAELLQEYLSALGGRVKVISVNNGTLLEPVSNSVVQVINLTNVTPPEFDNLLFSADLLLTENKVSISMGKAVCGLLPAAVLKNSYDVLDLLDRCSGRVRKLIFAMEADRAGSVFRFESYPTDLGDLLDRVILYKQNSLTRGFAELEVFGGDATADKLVALLTNEDTRSQLREHQQDYIERLRATEDGATVLERMVSGWGAAT